MTDKQTDAETETEADEPSLSGEAADVDKRRSKRLSRWLVILVLGVAAFAAWRYYPQYAPRLWEIVDQYRPSETGKESAGADMPTQPPPSDPQAVSLATPEPERGLMQAAPMDDAPPLGGDAPADVFIADDSLAEDIAALSMRVDKLAETIGGIAEQTATVHDATDDLSARVPDVEEAVRILSGALTELSEGVVALSNRVAALEAAGPLAGAAGKLSYAIGLRELDRAVSGSGPYATELSAISPFVEEDDPGFAVLEKYAAQGVYSVATLRTAFASVAGAAVRADGTDPEGDWADRMWDSLRALVVVRPIGEQAGGGTAAIVARAETRLAAGDLAAAVREVENLEGPAAAAAEAWLGDAHARLEVEQALAGLTLRLTRALAEGEG